MKILPLTDSPLVALVSDEDYDAVRDRNWFIRKNGYIQSKHQTLHRAIMKPPVGMEVDHINRDKLDNRRENLRICTHAENSMNKGHWSASGEKYIYSRPHGSYQVIYILGGKLKHIGYRRSLSDAIAIRDAFLSTLPNGSHMIETCKDPSIRRSST
jgi:hypothetical protein